MPKENVMESVRFQQKATAKLNSPFYADLLASALKTCSDDEPFWQLLDSWEGNPLSSLLTLRLLGALHDLVLAGRADDLAAHFPRLDTPGDPARAWAALPAVIERERSFLEARLDDEVQTNEVRRCNALLPGFLEVNERAQLPMRLAELGASAGLNLCWDRYHYNLGGLEWGSESSPLHLDTTWRGDTPKASPLVVASRRGCDISPLDLQNENDRRRLQSFVWPDQFERQALLARAITAARELPIEIASQCAGDFVDDILAERQDGQVTVIYHSIMWVYVPEAERERITLAISQAGESATPESPLAWLRMEFLDDEKAALFLDYWPKRPGREEREVLAHCHFHGIEIDWFGAES
jgi:hypothetical protein